ncbi:MAG TPA: diguanylate cyclase [Solirubrobacteraceae bacterium]|jgi:diguanylate cyclase (GGDEF)-like protein/putative nucleotidyltransferase with HDIG domain
MTAFPTDDDLGTPVARGVGFGIDIVGASFDPSLMARALACLFAAGATLVLLTVALPHSPRADVLALLAIAGNAYLVASVLAWRARALPARFLPLALAWGSTLITGVAYFSAESPSPLVFFYLWVFLYSAYFFTTTEMAVQILYVGLAYGGLLISRPPSSGVPAWWLVGMGTLLVAAILIRSMRERVELLIARLYDAARTDPLTRLSNRRGFRELLDLELARARRAETHMTVVVGDVDHFKEVNDRSGHHVGDATLQRLARRLEAGKRQIDQVARVGGEEFALILPDTDDHGAFVLAERLRCELHEEFAADTVPVTISFGVASYPQHGETAGSLLRAADEALYAAKQSGRNRTVLHSPALREVSRASDGARDIEGERFVAVVLDLAEAVDLRFSGSARHSETVGRYAEMMARELGLSSEQTGRVRLAGLLHDIGKVGVPDSILKKPAKLTAEEFDAIKRHPELGAQILEHPSLADVRAWVGAHHERIDGEGYPRGCSGADIPLEARILAVADAYEAMTSDRSYRTSIGHAAARAELRRCAGTQFDPRVVVALLAVLEREAEQAKTALVPA